MQRQSFMHKQLSDTPQVMQKVT